MVQLTRLNQETFLLNPDLIEQVEITPTTVITLSNSHKLLVRESAEEVLRRILEFRRSVHSDKALPELTHAAGSVNEN
jgi:flagellar protein FlbD